MNYKYLFPYERIKPNTKIIIYGAGELGMDYLLQMQITGYCKVIAMADKNYKKYPQMVVPVIDPCCIVDWEFDYVVVAIRIDIAKNEIFRILKQQGVNEEKIVCIFERDIDCELLKTEAKESCEFGMQVEKGQTIALMISGGLGDNVIQKKTVVELLKLASEIPVDIYAIRHVGFLQYLYSDCGSIRNVIDDLGMSYRMNYKKYMLSITFEACHFLRVDEFKEELVKAKSSELYEHILKLREETEKDAITLNTPIYVSHIRRLLKGHNAYSGFNYNGVFDVSDNGVSLPRTSEGEYFYKKLKITERYVTVNFGSGECQDENKVSKMWPARRFEQTMELIKKEYPSIKMVQVGAKDAVKLQGADSYILGEKIQCVIAVLEHALFHLDIEGGLVHMATQVGTKCVVLFGPTIQAYYGYSQNENISAGSCHNCWGLYKNASQCARGMAQPECMYAITPEMVMEHIRKVMKEKGIET